MVLMTCCGERFEDVRASMNHECTGDHATARRVAQAISRAIDEHQEFGGHDSVSTGLFLDDAIEYDDTDLRIQEVGAELETAANGLQSQFAIKTSDGREWTVRVTPKA